MIRIVLLAISFIYGISNSVLGNTNNSFRKGKDYALFFAVNKYQHLDNLNNPIADAKKLAKKLEDQYEFEAEVIENPNRKEIKEKLEYYRDQFKSGAFDPNGQLIIFFTGHGVFDEGAKNGFFMPQDGEQEDLQATAIPYSYWRPFISNINCQHILVAIDACYSGTFDQKIIMKSGDVETDPSDFKRPKELTEKERLIQNNKDHKTRLYLTSSAKEKTPDKSQFSKKLFKALDEGGRRDGLLTAGEIFELYLKSVRPTPIFGEFLGDEAGSNFLFFPKEAKDLIGISKAEKEKIATFQSELQVWEAAKQKNTIGAYGDYKQQFPNGNFVDAAEVAMEKLGAEYIMSGNRMFDKRDNQTYQTVLLNGKSWMAQNLNYVTEDSYCYKDKDINCEKYGRLYTWEAAKKACPKGWHLPSDEEWKELANRAGGYYEFQRGDVKSPNKGYQNLMKKSSRNFSAQLGGYRYSNGNYDYLGKFGYYWGSTEYDDGNAWYFSFDSDDGKLYRYYNLKTGAQSVRCIKD